MEPDGSSPYSQAPATCPYPEPDRSSLCRPSNLLKIHFNIFSHLRLCLASVLLPSRFPTKALYAPLCPVITVIQLPCVQFVKKNDSEFNRKLNWEGPSMHTPKCVTVLRHTRTFPASFKSFTLYQVMTILQTPTWNKVWNNTAESNVEYTQG